MKVKKLITILFTTLSLIACNKTNNPTNEPGVSPTLSTPSIKEYEIVYEDSGLKCGSTELKHWQDRHNVDRYPSFIYNNLTYSYPNYINGEIQIKAMDSGNIKQKIGDVVISGFDYLGEISEEDTISQAEIFEIISLSRDSALAIKFSDSDDYYGYINKNASYKTMNELMEKLSFKDNVIFSNISYTYYDDNDKYHLIRFDKIDDTYIYEHLFNDLGINDVASIYPNPTYVQYKRPFITITTYVPIINLGQIDVGVGLNEDGYLIIDFLGRLHVYQLGKEVINYFKNYLLTSIDGVEIIKIYPTCPA